MDVVGNTVTSNLDNDDKKSWEPLTYIYEMAKMAVRVREDHNQKQTLRA